ncbi:MAG: 2OG-Fe(II) oxygenase [Pseudomonadota bacterium]
MALADDMAAAGRAGGDGSVAALVERRAAAGDVEALRELGMWRLWGLVGPQNVAQGYGYTLEAAKRGSVDATLTLAGLLNTGTGLPRDAERGRAVVAALADRSPAAAEQLRVAATAPPPPTTRDILRADPLVERIDGLLSAKECAYLIERATPAVAPSTVIDPATQRRIPNPIRTSHGTNFPPTNEDVVVHAINCRIAEATGTHWEQGEPLHILRYQPGQQYRRHFDALPGVANQRVLTCLIYLNHGFSGGETAFGDALKVKGRAGDAIVFANTTPDGRADPRTEHAGLPVTRGVKWLATRWIRARRTHPWEPDTLL